VPTTHTFIDALGTSFANIPFTASVKPSIPLRFSLLKSANTVSQIFVVSPFSNLRGFLFFFSFLASQFSGRNPEECETSGA
jgi:hypothetical protein